MDLSKLSQSELADFVYKKYSGEWNPDLTYLDRAQTAFNQLQTDPNATYTLPVIDLYLSSIYGGPRNQQYTQDQILNLTPNEVEVFAQVFRFNPQENNLQVNRERILRILRFLNLLDLPSYQEVQLLPGYQILGDMKLNGGYLSIYIGAEPNSYQNLVYLEGEDIQDWSFLETPAIRTNGPIQIRFEIERSTPNEDQDPIVRDRIVYPKNGIITVGDIFNVILVNNAELNDLIPDVETEKVDVDVVKHLGGNQFAVGYFEP